LDREREREREREIEREIELSGIIAYKFYEILSDWNLILSGIDCYAKRIVGLQIVTVARITSDTKIG